MEQIKKFDELLETINDNLKRGYSVKDTCEDLGINRNETLKQIRKEGYKRINGVYQIVESIGETKDRMYNFLKGIIGKEEVDERLKDITTHKELAFYTYQEYSVITNEYSILQEEAIVKLRDNKEVFNRFKDLKEIERENALWRVSTVYYDLAKKREKKFIELLLICIKSDDLKAVLELDKSRTRAFGMKASLLTDFQEPITTLWN